MTQFKHSISTLTTSRWSFALLKGLVKMVFAPFFKIRVIGRENIEMTKPVVFLPKHQRWEDAPLIGSVLPRPVFFIAKYEMFQNRLFSFLYRGLGAVPINRQKPMASRDTFRFIIELLKKDFAVVLFPEGTYYKNHMGPGFFGMMRYIVSRVDVSFIPVGVRYHREKGRCIIYIRFGKGYKVRPGMSSMVFFQEMMEQIDQLSDLGSSQGSRKKRFIPN